ncbi:MAG: VOC family protein [Bacteroidota bacterium]
MKNTILFPFVVLLVVHFDWAQTALDVNKVTITVNDLDVSVPFFEKLLGFTKIEENETSGEELADLFGLDNPKLVLKTVSLKLGEEHLDLQEFVNEKSAKQIPIDSRSNDLWFQHIAIVVSDMDLAYERLWKYGVTHVSTAPQTLPENITAAAGIKAFYFQDPDGHNLELIFFPKGKGDPKWQAVTDKTFLGIDHTAIGINNTENAKHFYQNIIGLKTMGHSENYGTEQEHLNQVFGARLWISGLRAKRGFGLEFLDYIAPPGGRPFPKTSLPTDLWHWHTTIKIEDVERVYNRLREERALMVSKRIVKMDNKKKFMVRDVDGHALIITE